MNNGINIKAPKSFLAKPNHGASFGPGETANPVLGLHGGVNLFSQPVSTQSQASVASVARSN